MAKQAKGNKLISKPKDMRSQPNPSLRPGTGTMDMAKAMLRGQRKKK